MNKYFLVYYLESKEVSGVNYTHISLAYALNSKTISATEQKLKKALKAKKVTILRYHLLSADTTKGE